MKILVILASYNGANYIKEQIESILNQDAVEVDIKIFDDVSKDNTVEVVNHYIQDDRIQLSINTSPTGSAASNFFNAIKNISEEVINQYDFVSFSDQDDIWLPNKLNAAAEMLRGNQSSLYMSNLILWEENGNKKTIIKKCYPQKKYDFLFEGGSAGCTYVFTNEFCIDLKRTLEKVDYEQWKFFSHDWFVYFFARINDYQVSIDPNAYILYRIHEHNVHGQLNVNSLYAIIERLKLIKKGWYFSQIKGFIRFTSTNSVEKKIYHLYSKNYFTRLYILLRYNFDLMRSSKKFIQFFVVSVLPLKNNR